MTAGASASWGTRVVLLVASLIGLGAFLYPFLLVDVEQTSDQGGSPGGLAPLLFAGVSVICLVAMLVTLAEEHPVSRSRQVALLGVLVAVDATLRLVPSLLGASPIFLLIMLVGFVFGASLGFQMGVLTLLFSALITGGLGPWLPFQMLVAGWIGLTAGWLPHPRGMRWRVGGLAVFGAVWGLAFGALMNLWFWPFTAPGAGDTSSLYWSPGLGLAETVERYVRFYVVTSLGFDLARAIGNIVLVVIFAAPVIRLLERYKSRFTWQPWEEMDVSPPVDPVERPATL